MLKSTERTNCVKSEATCLFESFVSRSLKKSIHEIAKSWRLDADEGMVLIDFNKQV